MKYDYLIVELKRPLKKIDAEKIIDIFLKDLKEHVKSTSMSDGEFKLGSALIELFDNYGNIFIGNDNNKFNKNVILLSLREMTNLSTKEIRNSMKKYKKLYGTTIGIFLK